MSEKKHVVPWVKKQSITIVAVSDVGNEPHALRNVLEAFNYRVDIIWVGSRKEFIKILDGTIKTANYVILSTHGVDEGITIPDEDEISPSEIAEKGKLSGKVILNTGCTTGKKVYGDAFIKGAKAKAYIASTGAPSLPDVLIFTAHLFGELHNLKKKPLKAAVKKARDYNKGTAMFKIFTK